MIWFKLYIFYFDILPIKQVFLFCDGLSLSRAFPKDGNGIPKKVINVSRIFMHMVHYALNISIITIPRFPIPFINNVFGY